MLSKRDKKILYFFPPGNSYEGSPVVLDIDIDDCFTTLAVNKVEEHLDMTNISVIRAKKEHNKLWRSALAKYMATDAKTAKKELQAILHMGWPTHELAMLWNLALEVQKAIEFILGLPEFLYLQEHFGNRRNPQATRVHYAMSSIEDAILSDLVRELEFIPDLRVNTYMFDGALVLTRGEQVGEVKKMMKKVEQKWKVTFSVEVW